MVTLLLMYGHARITMAAVRIPLTCVHQETPDEIRLVYN